MLNELHAHDSTRHLCSFATKAAVWLHVFYFIFKNILNECIPSVVPPDLGFIKHRDQQSCKTP